jgi:hypothetical protein
MARKPRKMSEEHILVRSRICSAGARMQALWATDVAVGTCEVVVVLAGSAQVEEGCRSGSLGGSW